MSLSVTLDKATYAPGDTMRLTVKTTKAERDVDVPVQVTVSIPGLGEATATAIVDKPPVGIVVSDTARAWTPVSDDGATAVFTATA